MVSSADLSPDIQDRPAAQQLYFSLIKYMNSNSFNNLQSIDYSIVKDIFTTGSKLVFNAYTNASPDELKPKKAITQ